MRELSYIRARMRIAVDAQIGTSSLAHTQPGMRLRFPAHCAIFERREGGRSGAIVENIKLIGIFDMTGSSHVVLSRVSDSSRRIPKANCASATCYGDVTHQARPPAHEAEAAPHNWTRETLPPTSQNGALTTCCVTAGIVRKRIQNLGQCPPHRLGWEFSRQRIDSLGYNRGGRK